jgi:hypothetical protein
MLSPWSGRQDLNLYLHFGKWRSTVELHPPFVFFLTVNTPDSIGLYFEAPFRYGIIAVDTYSGLPVTADRPGPAKCADSFLVEVHLVFLSPIVNVHDHSFLTNVPMP